MEITSKQCSKCKEVKGVGEFYKKTVSKDGLMARCKQCINENKRLYQKQCPTCEGDFKTPKKSAKFCSIECKRYETECAICKKKITGLLSYTSKKFCSEKCKGKFHDSITEKRCKKCGVIKTINEFYNNEKSLAGRLSECKRCFNERKRKSRREQKLKEYMESIGYEETDKTIPAEIDLNSTKACTICEQDKPLREFRAVYKDKKFNRFHAHCKPCASEKAKEYRRQRELRIYKEIHERGKAELERKQKELEEKGEM
jgi:hypothetical protein